jgi:hypothetical protein
MTSATVVRCEVSINEVSDAVFFAEVPFLTYVIVVVVVSLKMDCASPEVRFIEKSPNHGTQVLEPTPSAVRLCIPCALSSTQFLSPNTTLVRWRTIILSA